MEPSIKCNLPNIWIYHIVYTKRTKEVVMYRHPAGIVEYLENGYTSISFNTDNTIRIYDKVVKLKWYKDTDYICWDYTQRKHIFVKDPVKAMEIFGSKDFKNFK